MYTVRFKVRKTGMYIECKFYDLHELFYFNSMHRDIYEQVSISETGKQI